MEITLRAETEADRRAKASGVSVEAQTGEPTFDARVYAHPAPMGLEVGVVISALVR